jgi:hypothetical protein
MFLKTLEIQFFKTFFFFTLKTFKNSKIFRQKSLSSSSSSNKKVKTNDLEISFSNPFPGIDLITKFRSKSGKRDRFARRKKMLTITERSSLKTVIQFSQFKNRSTSGACSTNLFLAVIILVTW